jgi:hypothetical protein
MKQKGEKRGVPGGFIGGLTDTDQRDPKGVWPNLSWRSNRQQDKSVVEQIRSTPRTAKHILTNQQAKQAILVSPDMGPFSIFSTQNNFNNSPYIGAHPFGFIVAADLPIT